MLGIKFYLEKANFNLLDQKKKSPVAYWEYPLLYPG